VNPYSNIAEEVSGLSGVLGGRLIAVNPETGEVGGETFDAFARPALRSPWQLLTIRQWTPEGIKLALADDDYGDES